MANEMMIVSTQLPAYLQEMGGYQDAGLSAGITPKAPKLGMTIDKHWTITEEGNTIQLPVDEKGRAVFRGVIVAASGSLTKAWYEKPYQPGSTEAPDCFSNDARIPAPGVKKPQHTNCASCPKNAYGSHPVTGRGKACGDRKMVVLVWEGAPSKLMGFNVPTMSLQALARLEGELRNANIPLQSVMLEFSFNPSVVYPTVQIGAVGFIDRETAMKLRDASESEEVMLMLREVDYEIPESAQVPAQGVAAQLAGAPTLNLGGGVVETGAQQAQQAAQQPQQQAQTNQPAPAAAGRRRRATKAEMEARRAAEAAPPQQVQQPAADPAAAKIAELQAQLAALQGGGQQAAQTVELQEDPRVPATEQDNSSLLGGLTMAAQTPVPQAAPQPQSAPTSAGVADLLAKWRNG